MKKNPWPIVISFLGAAFLMAIFLGESIFHALLAVAIVFCLMVGIGSVMLWAEEREK